MRFLVNPDIYSSFSPLSFGILVCKGLDNERKITSLKQLLDGLGAALSRKFPNKEVLLEDPNIQKWKELYSKIEAKSYPPLLEKVVSPIIKQKDTEFTDNLNQLKKYMIAKKFISIVGFDIDQVYGDITITIEEKKVVYKDKKGLLTRRWDTKQEQRAEINKNSRNVVFIFQNVGAYKNDSFAALIREFGEMVSKYCHAKEFEEDIMEMPRKEKDLGIVGAKEHELLDEKEAKEESLPEEIKTEIQEEHTEDSDNFPATQSEQTQDAELEQNQEPQPEQTAEIEPEHYSQEQSQEPQPEQSQSNENSEIEDDAIKPVKPNQDINPKQQSTYIHQSLLSEDRTSLRFNLKKLITEATLRAYPSADIDDLTIEYPKDRSMGDYACSIPLKLAKQLLKNPMEIGEKIVQNIENVQFIGEVKVDPPGFINVMIARQWLENKVADISEGEEFYNKSIGEAKGILIDYSSPNIAKPLGVHHLLSTIIGQAVYNIYRVIGFETIGINHLGDWGTQFGKLIYAYRNWGNKKAIEKKPMEELLNLYVQFHDEAKSDKELDNKAREEFKKLEDGDEENVEMWKWFKELSLKELEGIYETLGVHFDEYLGESFYNDKMQEVIDEGVQKGVFKEGEGGAMIVDFMKEELPPYLIKKSDGATLYSTRDLAAIKYRIKRWAPNQLIYVVDVAQSLHFKQLFETAKLLGYGNVKYEHIQFGRMQLPDGGMSTREGKVVLLEELINEGLKRSQELVNEKSKELDKKEKEEIARKISIGAIKYNILSQNRVHDITFDWDRMLSLDGNSGPYLQYTVARAQSILRKYENLRKEKVQEKIDKGEILSYEEQDQTTLFDQLKKVEGYGDVFKPFEHPKEQTLVRQMMKFNEYLLRSAEEYKPHILAGYLYDLAQDFNSFYNAVSVLHEENKHIRISRIALTKAVSRILKKGLEILGIEVPERM